MIATLTMNPSMDRTIELDAPLQRGGVQRALSLTSQAAGKGVNVARALAAGGLRTLAVLPGDPHDPVVLGLADGDLPHVALPIGQPLRSNLTLAEADGTTTKVNAPGPLLDAGHQRALVEAVLAAADGASWLVLAGSLPPGVAPGFYAELVAEVRDRLGARAPRIAVDTSGAPLAALFAAGPAGTPDLIKPNAEELAELTGEGTEAGTRGRPRTCRPRGAAARRGRCRGRAGHARLEGRRAGHRRRQLARNPRPRHRAQHRRRRRLGPGRLPARRRGWRGTGRLPAPGRRPRIGRRRPAGLHHSRPRTHQPARRHRRRASRSTPHRRKAMTRLITEELVLLDRYLGGTSTEVIAQLSRTVVATGRATDAAALQRDAVAREQKTATGVPGGIAIPHCRSTAVTEPTLAMARLVPPVDFGAKDGPADLIFFIAAPEGADKEHLKLLSKLARSLVKKDFTAALRAAGSPAEIVGPGRGRPSARHRLPRMLPPRPRRPARAAPAPAERRRLVAVTACPTGIAHTYMAADSLVAAAAEAGVDLQVETQGSSGATPLDPAVIAAAEAVIFAVDVDVRGKERFAGKPVIQSPVKRGIDEPAVMVAEALAAADRPERTPRRLPAPAGGRRGGSPAGRESAGAALKRALLTGVSYMIPFVAGGGLLIALGFLLGGYAITDRRGRRRRGEHPVQPARCRRRGTDRRPVRPARRLPRCRRLQDRRPVDGLPGPRAGRLHRLRPRRPSRPGPRLHRRRRGRIHGRRLPRRHRRRPDRRPRRPLDRQLEGPALAARTDAGGHHPAARLDHRLRC